MPVDTGEKRNEVFIVGAGLSKQVHDQMPLLMDLSSVVEEKFKTNPTFQSDRIKPFIQNGDFELLLSYLHTDSPWKSPSESLDDKSLFFQIADVIADEIIERETASLIYDKLPVWLEKLEIYFDWFQPTVISFNYDTILERAAWLSKSFNGERASFSQHIYATHLYLPIMQDIRVPSSRARIPDSLGRGLPTFRLIKLHGSINWFYSGSDDFPGEQVYFAEAQKNNPKDDYQIIEPYVLNKQRLIIPPVSEKTSFYSNFLVRALWKESMEALKDAERIFFIGYSLPQTDLMTMQLLLSSISSEAEVFVVSEGNQQDTKKQELIERYKNAIPQVEDRINTKYVCKNAIFELARDLTGDDPQVYNINPSRKLPKDEDLLMLWNREE